MSATAVESIAVVHDINAVNVQFDSTRIDFIISNTDLSANSSESYSRVIPSITDSASFAGWDLDQSVKLFSYGFALVMNHFTHDQTLPTQVLSKIDSSDALTERTDTQNANLNITGGEHVYNQWNELVGYFSVGDDHRVFRL